MRSFFGYIFLGLFFLLACKGNKIDEVAQTDLSQSQPIVVPLDLGKGYVVNKITGDSIRTLINSSGKIITTGIPYSITPEKPNAPGINHPVIRPDNSKVKTSIESNIYPLKGKPRQVAEDGKEISSISVSANSDSIVISKSAHVVLTHQTFPVTLKRVVVIEPQPLKIQPLRYKDNALLDIQYLDIGQGLPYSYVYAMLQDKNGCLWLGTDYGLCKYDGTYLTVYTEKEGLINNKISSIVEDKMGRLWIGTYGGITVFDGSGFLQFTDKDGLLTRYIGDITKDEKDNIWFALEGLGVVRIDDDVFTLYSIKRNFFTTIAPSIFADQEGTIWLNAPGGLIRYDGRHFVYLNPGAGFLEAITTILKDRKGNSWFLSNASGITKFDGRFFTHYTIENGLSDNSIISLMIDRNDDVWVGTRYKGVNKFDGKNFIIYNSGCGLSEDKITCTLEDKQGNIWIGTLGGGINKLNNNGFSEKIPLSKFNNSRIRPIIRDKYGKLWFGTEDGGLYSYDGIDLTQHIERKGGSIIGFRSVMKDKNNDLWFGEQEGSGFYKYDYKQFYYFSPPKKISTNLSLFEDNSGAIWIGTTKEGVAVFKNRSIEYYNEASGFPSNRVFVTKQDKKGNLWFGTEGGGLVKYDGQLFTVLSEKQGLFCKGVTSILEDENENLWLGTIEGGLCKFDGKNFTYYTEKNGLAFNTVWSLKKDNYGQIWVGTDNGLSVLIPGNKTDQADDFKNSIYSFGLQDGLKATDFNLNGVCIDDNNRIWWGTGKALITRDLNSPFKTDTPQSLQLNYIMVNDQFRDFRNIGNKLKSKINFSSVQPFQNYPNDLSLAYDHNHIIFNFSAKDWKAPHKLMYSYRLLGQDKNWSPASSETSVDYRNLSYGDYEFQVKAIGQSQVWTQPLFYKFTILPAWWQTWWFKATIVVLTVAFVIYITWLVYLYRLRKQRTQLEKQLAIQYERQRISSEMHDDIGAGLSGVKLLTEITRSKIKDKAANDEIDKIYESVRDISAKMKEVIWSLNTENDSLNSLLSYLQTQSRKMMENYPGTFDIVVPEEIPDLKISGDARRHIHLLVKEALHNAIKHSAATNVKLIISCDKVLKILVADNGKGMPANDYDNSGNGIKNMRQRIRQLNGIILLENNNGLKLIFEIPLK